MKRAPKCTMYDAVVKAAEYCAKASDPESICFSKAQTTFFNHGPNRKDSVVKAAEYCAKASDPEGTCLLKAQMTFFNHGFNAKDSVVKAAEYCAKASDPEGTCISKAQVEFFNNGFNKNDGDNSVVMAAERKLENRDATNWLKRFLRRERTGKLEIRAGEQSEREIRWLREILRNFNGRGPRLRGPHSNHSNHSTMGSPGDPMVE